MGYSYARPGGLCCDNCGQPGNGTRKRTCPHKVTSDSLRGPRMALPYCPPPALCSPCLTKLGGGRAVHAKCAEGAATMQARYDAVESALDAGESFGIAAWGDWHKTVPQGMVGVLFKGRPNGVKQEGYFLVSKEHYDARGDGSARLSACDTMPWLDHA